MIIVLILNVTSLREGSLRDADSNDIQSIIFEIFDGAVHRCRDVSLSTNQAVTGAPEARPDKELKLK